MTACLSDNILLLVCFIAVISIFFIIIIIIIIRIRRTRSVIKSCALGIIREKVRKL